jgi:DNA-binding transcriptional ArsR family regulator
MKRTKVAFDQEKLQFSSELLRALAHPLRLQILEFIDQHKEINVNKIYHSLQIEQSITSQHLKVMRMAGIVDHDKDGKYIHYRIDYDRLEKTAAALDNFRKTDELLKARALQK